MALKIFTIIMALFVAEITFLATKEPKKLKQQKREILNADLTFTNLKGKILDQNGSKGTLQASKAIKYSDYEKLFDIKLSYKDKNLTSNLSSKRAIHKKNRLLFKDSVEYENNQSMKILAKSLEYNLKNKVVSSDQPFHLQKDNATISGENFIYDTKKNLLEIQKVKYTQEVKR